MITTQSIFSTLLKKWEPTVELLDNKLCIEKETKIRLLKKNSQIDPEIAILRNVRTILSYLEREKFFSSVNLKPAIRDLTMIFALLVSKNSKKIEWEDHSDYYELGKKILLSALQLQEDGEYNELIKKNIPIALIMNIVKYSTCNRQPELFDYIFSQFIRLIDKRMIYIRPELSGYISKEFLGNLIPFIEKIKRVSFDQVEFPTGQIMTISEFDFKYSNENVIRIEDDDIKLLDIRKEIFRRTVEVSQNSYLIEEKPIKLDANLTKKMQERTKVWTLDSLVMLEPQRKKIVTKFLVENIDTFDLMKRLIEQGYNPVGLNMANKEEPGGGVSIGAPAQEESLFRRSNYYQSLFPDQNPHLRKQLNGPYQIPEHGLIYSPFIQVFRTNEEEGYKFCLPYPVTMVATAAYDRRPLGDALTDKEIEIGMKEKVRAILRCAYLYKHDAVILGAWGCGAFLNNPSQIALLMSEVFNEEEFHNKFALIAFPILKVAYAKDSILDVFSKQFL